MALFDGLYMLLDAPESANIRDNGFVTIRGIASLDSPEDTRVTGNVNLQHFYAFAGLISTPGLRITGNPALREIRLPDLWAVAFLDIEDNGITAIHFDSLQWVEALSVARNEHLGIMRFPAWETPGDVSPSDVTIIDNPTLSALDGFPLVEHLGYLHVMRNASLTELSWPRLRSVLNDLVVTDNPQLSTCQANALHAQLEEGPASVLIAGNAPCSPVDAD